MTTSKKAAVFRKLKDLAQQCGGLAMICNEDDENDQGCEGYVARCLEDAKASLDLALKRLRGESTLSEPATEQ